MTSIIGEAPGGFEPHWSKMRPFLPIGGGVLNHLCRLAWPELTARNVRQSDRDYFLARHDAFNLLPWQPRERESKGRTWNADAAGDAARFLLSCGWRPHAGHLLVLGRRAAAEFGMQQMRWFNWTEVTVSDRFARSMTFIGAVMPHPSGIVQWWNFDANVATATEFFKGLPV